MLKILQARLQQNVNHEVLDVQAGFRKGRGTRDQIATIHWLIEKAREFQKNIYSCCIDYTKSFDWVDHDKLWKILQEMGIPDHLTCLLRNLYAGHIMRNAGLDEAQAGIKIARRNINNLGYADGITYGRKWRRTKEPLDESERGEWKSWLKAQHSEN